MKNILLFAVLFCSTSLFSQNYDAERYRSKIFASSTAQIDVQYGSAPQWVFPYWDEDLYVDIYTPTGDNNPKRPLIIFAHSGGFLNGAKDVDNMVAICDSFAQKGYVTASIAYRKGFNPLDGQSAERAVYRGIQDGKAAVRYFKEYANIYKIDTNNIFFGGMSAGGYIALHAAYMDKESERPASTFGGGTVNDLGCLDCAGNSYNHTSEVKAILDYWGAVQDTSIIEPGNIPVMIMHGENDPTVPFVYGHPFGLPTLPQTYGGQPISERAQALGIPYEYYTSQGSLHMLDGSDNGTFVNPPNSFWSDTLLPRTTDFLIDLIEPKPNKISPDTIQICFKDTADFAVTDFSNHYYEWGYASTGVTTVSNNNTADVSLSFTAQGSYDIYSIAFNEVLCASDTLWFHVEVLPEVQADFAASITNFNEASFSSNASGGNSLYWDFGDGSTSNDMNPAHTYTANGTYDVTLVVTNDLGCTDTLTKQVSIEGLSITNNALEEIQIYPNPFDHEFQIRLSDEGHRYNYSVMDISGKVVASNTFTGKTIIHTEQWTKGAYILKIIDGDGNISSHKLIKIKD